MEPTAEPYSTWVPMDSEPGSIAVRVVVLAAIALVAFIAARGAMEMLDDARRDVPRRVGRRVSGVTALPWDPAFWMCASCRSSNDLVARSCRSCGSARADAELHAEPVERADDVLPATVIRTSGLVRLDHDAAAHVDPLAAHWRLVVNGVTVGSVAHGSRVPRLLGQLDGAQVVLYDELGTGPRPYRAEDLAGAFARAPLPLRLPCPDLAG